MAITLTHKNVSADVTGTAQSYTVTATTAGNLLIVFFNFRTNSTDTITSVTDGGDSFVSANCRSIQNSGRAQETWYCSNISAGKTTLTINQSGAGVITVTAFEYHSTLGLFSFDTSGATPAGTSVSGTGVDTGPSVTTTKASDVLVTYVVTSGNWVSANTPFIAQSGDGHGNEICDIEGQAAATLNYTGTEDATSGFISMGTAAFAEASAATIFMLGHT